MEPMKSAERAMDSQAISAALPVIDPQYTAEIRFGVVMYGGVSLAIYINGVTNELFEMACATPRPGTSIDRENEPGTREIYRRLSWLVGNRDLCVKYAESMESFLPRRSPTASSSALCANSGSTRGTSARCSTTGDPTRTWSRRSKLAARHRPLC
jgi:hypothetical protein